MFPGVESSHRESRDRLPTSIRGAQTVPELILARVQATPDAAAFVQPGKGPDQRWTWAAVAAGAVLGARQLSDLGIERGDRCLTICENRIEWVMLDWAIQLIGAVHVPLNPNLSLKQIGELMAHCAPRGVVASSSSELRQHMPAESRDKCVLVALDDQTGEATDQRLLFERRTEALPLEELLAELAAWREAWTEPHHVTSILYTSGTTGKPKGVMLSPANLVSNVWSKLDALPLGPSDVRLAWLPWTHIFGRVCDLYTGLAAGCETVISRGKERLFDELLTYRPTYLNGVPYFYEKCYRILESRGELDCPGALLRLLGGRMKLCNCGGAPLSLHVFDYFREAGVELVCGYGLTETSPVLTSNRPAAWRRGSVGQPVAGVQLRLAADGEIMARGPNVMLGYFRDSEQTASVMDGEWFRTGDLGELDDDGFLYIRGRKKELIVLSTGLKVAPIFLEQQIAADPLIHQCLVVGEQRNYLIALITLDAEQCARRWPDREWSPSPSETVTFPEVRQAVQDVLNKSLADRPPQEQIKSFAIVARPFTADEELVTAKQSLRREAIAARYQGIIEGLYARRPI